MMDCNSMATPMVTILKKLSDSTSDSNLMDLMRYRQLTTSLMDLGNTMPNILFVVNTLSQYMVELRQIHWIVEKHLLRYLRGTLGYGLRYVLGSEVRL